MGSETPQLHIFFFPFMAHGHMIPTLDMAKLFANRGVKTTIITTPLNDSFFSNAIQKAKESSGVDIGIKTLKLPSVEAGSPEGGEKVDLIPTDTVTQKKSQERSLELFMKFFTDTVMFREPLEQLLEECKPDCLVADMFFPWATDAANKFGIPRLVFHGFSFFCLCASECMRLYEPHKKVQSDSEPFMVPNLPGDIKFTKKQLPDYMKEVVESDFTKMMKASKESEVKSYGVLVNSFYELEATYADYYRNVLGRKAWHVGPVSLCNRASEDRTGRGKDLAVHGHECLKWLDSKQPNSVVYISFGSMTSFTSAQLKEIAMALEASEQQFIWVVRKEKNNEDEEDWLPEGFEKRVEGKGLIIRKWAPQVLILDHEAVGGFVTHCGWNSTLEGVSAGVPMVTWPIFADQFYNEKLVTQVLKIGMAVGVQQYVRTVGDFVRRESIERAVKEIMKGDKAEEMRNRANALAEAAKRAVEKGGSSYSDLNALIKDLSSHRYHLINNQKEKNY